MLLISFRWLASTADFTSTWTMDPSFTILSVMTGAFELMNALQVWSSLIVACLSTWAISSNVNAHTFESAAPAAAFVWRPIGISSRFNIFWKDALSVLSARSSALFPNGSLVRRDLVDCGCWLAFSIINQKLNESVYAENHNILWLVTGQL